jgi:SAM-dependent methyltransferase
MKREFDPDHPEMMDQPGLDPVLLAGDLLNLRRINRWFGGWKVSDLLFEKLLAPAYRGRRLLVDVCTGSADLPRRALSLRPHENALIIAVDYSVATLAEAKRLSANEPRLCFVRADARHLPFRSRATSGSVCALALHHFSPTDAVMVLRELRRVSRGLAAASDLVRGRRHLWGAWLLTTLLLRNPITRHDAVASVRRSFSRSEFADIGTAAGWTGATHVNIPLFRQAIWHDGRPD